MVDISTMDRTKLDQIMGKKPETEIDPLRDLIPAYARVQIQLCDKSTLDDCADVLASLAQEIRLLARRHDLTQSQVLYYAWNEIKSANSRMQSHTRYRKQP